MADGDDVEQAEAGVYGGFELGMLWPVHPLKDGQYEYRQCQRHRDNLIHQRHFQIAVHAIIQWWEGTASNQYADTCIVESTEYSIRFYINNDK